jgi:hypothetical protein
MLGARPDGDLAGGFEFGGGDMGLEVAVLNHGGGEGIFGYEVRPPEAFLHVSLSYFEMIADIGSGRGEKNRDVPVSPQVLVDEGGPRFHRLPGVKYGRQFFVVHFDQLQGLPGGVRINRRDPGHGVSDVPDFVKTIGELVLNHQPVPNVQILARRHRFDPGKTLGTARVYVQNPGMGKGTAQHLSMEHPRKFQIGPVDGPSGDFFDGVNPGHAGPDDPARFHR